MGVHSMSRVLGVLLLASMALTFRPSCTNAGEITKSFPDLEGQVELFLNLRIGMTYKEFRASVPAAWFAIAVPSVEFVGKVDDSPRKPWFTYRLAARGIQQPRVSLGFWQNKLATASLDYKHRFTAGIGDDAHESAVQRIDDLLMRRFGEPSEEARRDSMLISLSWQRNGTSIRFEVSDDGIHPFGMVRLLVIDEQSVLASSEWDYATEHVEGSGPGVFLICTHADPVPGVVEMILETIDTRALSNRAAVKLAKRRAKTASPPGFKCTPDIKDIRVTDILLNTAKNGQRLPYTYLRFKNDDGFLTTQKFEFAGADTQDAVCEKFRKRLPRSVRKTAECITGIELPYKRY